MRRSASLAAAALFALAPFETRAQPGAILLQERVPLAFLVTTPTGEAANTSSSDLIRIVSALTEKHTNFFLQVTDPQVATDCRGKLGCLVQQLRAPYPKFFLVISNVTLAGEADRLSAVLVDVQIAIDYSHGTNADEDAEARINEYAILLGPERAQVKDATETQAFVERLFRDRFAKIFKESDNWEPFGSIVLEAPVEGVAINLDGVAIGVTRPGETLIQGVIAGPRRIALEHPAYEPFQTEVTVERGATARVSAILGKRVSGTSRAVRTGLFWSGAATAVAGVTITSLALIAHDGAVTPVCFRAPGAACRDGASFQTFGYMPDAAPGQTINPGGVLVAPLGLALIATGATWSLGTWLLGEESDFPWIQMIAGAAAGGLVYGAGALLSASPGP